VSAKLSAFPFVVDGWMGAQCNVRKPSPKIGEHLATLRDCLDDMFISLTMSATDTDSCLKTIDNWLLSFMIGNDVPFKQNITEISQKNHSGSLVL
jgi:hypothetical protein